MKVSAIVCHHKGRLILKALQSLKIQKNVELEIIVVTSCPNVSFYGVKTVFIKGLPAYKRNIALRYATHDYIAFFDDDVELKENAVFEMVNFLEKYPQVGMVFGKLLNMEFKDRFDEAGSYLTNTGFLWARSESGVKDTGQYDSFEPILAGKSASCIIRRKIFSDIGMFNPFYGILGEETDLAWRVWLYGHLVYYIPTSITYHAFNTKFKPKDFYTAERVYFNGCRNYLTMLTTNLELHNLIIPLFIQICAWIIASFGMVLNGRFLASWNIIKGLYAYFTHLDVILATRKRIQIYRVKKDSEIFSIIRKNPPLSYYLKRLLNYIKTGFHG